jgi:hypothetical protein
LGILTKRFGFLLIGLTGAADSVPGATRHGMEAF